MVTRLEWLERILVWTALIVLAVAQTMNQSDLTHLRGDLSIQEDVLYEQDKFDQNVERILWVVYDWIEEHDAQLRDRAEQEAEGLRRQ